MIAWILGLMVILQPSAPWRDTYEATAHAIAAASVQSPLFAGKDGPERTAAWVVATSWFESRFQPDAVGDHGRSLCMLQIGESNLKALGVTREAMLNDLPTCLRAGLAMMKGSLAVCRSHPLDERLANYASGHGTCTNKGGLIASRHRVGLALRLFKDHPPPSDGSI